MSKLRSNVIPSRIEGSRRRPVVRFATEKFPSVELLLSSTGGSAFGGQCLPRNITVGYSVGLPLISDADPTTQSGGQQASRQGWPLSSLSPFGRSTVGTTSEAK